MKMPIVIYGSSILRKKTFELDAGDDFVQMAENMKETLKNADGIGLAGPQVDLQKSLFVVDTTPLEGGGIEPIEKVFLNPVILNHDDNTTWYSEGCLSIPGIFEEVNRPEKIEVRYRDLNFDWKGETLTGLEARIFQHEYDHLQGILFVDRLNALRRKLIRGKLKQITKHK
ncbi:peptide deformylase [Tangfeifania diversioriginum]|uniref:Peptide deformylase n=1 Tax=Tangfeifania diversioriginum TaxID=1168035 RepID=A0A1M6L4Y1_9BACT|nr:peptide deformylase [Tangfeifania diversioriginum]SHJ66258.1 peptide deformylase [Tangfeifania diversioriginum]